MQMPAPEGRRIFGDQLRRMRTETGVSLRKLAADPRVHISYGQLSKVENDRALPTVELGKELDAVFGDQLPGNESFAVLARSDLERYGVFRRVSPAELPAAANLFVPRHEPWQKLQAVLEQPSHPGQVHIVVVCGAPGSGASTVALQWAHHVADRFAAGQLFADLRRDGRHAAPVESDVILGEWLAALGSPAGLIPDGAGRARAFRTRMAHSKPMLLLIEHASSSEEVRRLLPAGHGHLVIVTSRHRLDGLVNGLGAVEVVLGRFTAAESRTLLRAVAGETRVDAEPEAADRLGEVCGRLPVAVSAVARRAADSPEMLLTDLASELAKARDLVESLSRPGDPDSVREVLDGCDQVLDTAEAAEMWRLLGLHPGGEISVHAAAALSGCAIPTARARLDQLAADHLIESVGTQRWCWHGLLHRYAATRARAELSVQDRRDAVGRLVQWYVHSTLAAAAVLAPYDSTPPVGQTPQILQTSIAVADTTEDALAWFDREAGELVRVISAAREWGFASLAWRLAVASMPYWARRRPWRLWQAAVDAGLTAANEEEDQHGVAWCLHYQGRLQAQLGQTAEGLHTLQAAAALREQIGDERGLAWTRCALASVQITLDRTLEAASAADAAAQWFRMAGNDYGLAQAQLWTAMAAHRQGQPDVADDLHEALRLAAGALDATSIILVQLADVHRARGEYVKAHSCCTAALDARRRDGDIWGQAEVLLARGEIYASQGRVDQARVWWRQAHQVWAERGDPHAAAALARLATVGVVSPVPHEAMAPSDNRRPLA